MTGDWLPMRYTYDDQADAVFLYLVPAIRPAQARRSAPVPLEIPGASMVVLLDEAGQALGIEFLGASVMFKASALKAFRSGHSQFGLSGPS